MYGTYYMVLQVCTEWWISYSGTHDAVHHMLAASGTFMEVEYPHVAASAALLIRAFISMAGIISMTNFCIRSTRS